MNSNVKNQQLAFDKLSKLKVGALFLEQGTGKTKVALDLICSKRNKVDFVLWICPYSLKNEIEAERLKWHPELELTVVGCESIGSSGRIYLELLRKVESSKAFIVVDESLKIKNREAKRTQRILKLGEHSEYRLILNGTPLSKNVLDLWTQMQFLSPKILSMSYNEFKNTYCEYYIRGRLKGIVKKQHNVEHLISRIRPYIFDSELDIAAKKHYVDIPYSMTVPERKGYEQVKDDFLSSCLNSGGFDFFALSQILQSYYCGCKDKDEKLQEVISGIDGKVIIFVKYLDSIPNGALKVVGDMNMAARSDALERFRSGEKVLYITYGCGAFGLNLQFCRNIIFAEHTFDYAQREQAEARIYRMGQEHDVTYYNLWCNVGLERLIHGSLDKKSNLLDEVKKEIEKRGVAEWLNSI